LRLVSSHPHTSLNIPRLRRITVIRWLAAAGLCIAALSAAAPTAAWIRRLALVREPVTVGGRLVVEPLQLIAVAVSLVIAAVFVFVLS
jgi:hypothetical protein